MRVKYTSNISGQKQTLQPILPTIKDSGIGLRLPHLQQVIDTRPAVAWFEVHAENFFSDAECCYQLDEIAQYYPLSMHAVGLSLGSAEPLNQNHLQQLKAAVKRYQPQLISEHLSWGSINNHYFNDLLPMPYTPKSLTHFADKIKQVQDYLGRQILIENPSSYLRFAASTLSEWDFFAKLPSLTGCGLLLDVNNIFVSCHNFNYNHIDYFSAINPDDISEIHLAGYAKNHHAKGDIYIDDHGSEVSDEVLDLYQQTVEKFGKKPTLIEWDSNIPALSVLLAEAKKAQEKLDA